jgi:predicted unusual protein kinase regulating ubiquinone biosynthesis (AarF/ABC1/UbiB family)
MGNQTTTGESVTRQARASLGGAARVHSPVRSNPPRLSRLTQAIRFLRVARLLLWTVWVIYRERRRVVRARQRGDTDVQPNVAALIKVLVAFRKTALQLGGLMIKLGQFLSARADLLPEQALAVLGSLQDEVPAAPYSHVVSVIEQELGKPVDQLFSVLEHEATAAASLGQVHKAVLAATGQTVAVKVQRPNVDQLVRMDLSTMRFVIWLVTRFVDTSDVIDLMGFYREFRRTVSEELDYVAEAANARRFRELFKERPSVFIPLVCEGYVSRRVLVLEWVDGIKINDYAALEAAGISRTEVARRTVEAYLYQFFEVGFFHADPHPGNLFVQRGQDGSDPIVAFVDFGMVGTLAKGTKQAFKDVFLGFASGNAHAMVDGLQRLGFIGPGANLAAIERGVALMLEQYRGLTLGEARDLDFSSVAAEIEALLYGQPFRIPATLAFTGKAVGTLSGVATGLAPELNLVDVAVPYARQFLGLTGEQAGQTTQQLLTQLLEVGRTLLTVPAALERVLAKLDTGQIEIRVADAAQSGRQGRRSRAGGQATSALGGISWAVIVAASLTGATVLMLNHLMVPGWFCLGLAGFTVLLSWLRH